MRRITVQTFANLGRAAALGACLAAAGTAWVWHQAPATVAQAEAWLTRKAVGSYHAELQAARTETDPGRQRERLTALLGRLDHVRREDHLAEIVVDCQLRLADLAQSAGDLASAIAWLREAAAFDDHDLLIQTRLGDALCRSGHGRAEGLTLLKDLTDRFPGNPHVVPVFVRNLAAAGQAESALAALEAADRAPKSNLWLVLWDDGQGFDITQRRADAIPTVDDGLLRLRFGFHSQPKRIQIHLPAFASFALVAPRLRILSTGGAPDIDVLAAAEDVVQLERADDRFEATGQGGARFDLDLPALPAPWSLTFEARFVPRPNRLVAAPASAPVMADLLDRLAGAGPAADHDALRRWRRAALQGSLELFWRVGSDEFDSARRVTVGYPWAKADDRVDFDVTFAVGQPAEHLRIDLPPVPGYRFGDLVLEVAADGTTTALDLATLPPAKLHDLSHASGVLTITGTDPYLIVALPAAAAPRAKTDHVRFAGRVR
jgi:tetratricopeptide (TPR) repeat protein